MSQAITSAVANMIKPMLDEHGFELVDVEYVKEGGNRFLRIIVDKPGGIDIEDCGKISEFASRQLDVLDPIQEAYFLEVTSPGAERPLKSPADFAKAVGSNVYITTYEPVNGFKEFEGVLQSYDEQQAVVAAGKKSYTIPCDKIAGARLAVVF